MDFPQMRVAQAYLVSLSTVCSDAHATSSPLTVDTWTQLDKPRSSDQNSHSEKFAEGVALLSHTHYNLQLRLETTPEETPTEAHLFVQ